MTISFSIPHATKDQVQVQESKSPSQRDYGLFTFVQCLLLWLCWCGVRFPDSRHCGVDAKETPFRANKPEQPETASVSSPATTTIHPIRKIGNEMPQKPRWRSPHAFEPGCSTLNKRQKPQVGNLYYKFDLITSCKQDWAFKRHTLGT